MSEQKPKVPIIITVILYGFIFFMLFVAFKACTSSDNISENKNSQIEGYNDQNKIDNGNGKSENAVYEEPKIPGENKNKYITEAKDFFTSCFMSMHSKQLMGYCEEEQKRFAEEYVNAFSGDINAQRNTARMMFKDNYGGILPEYTQSCAWRLVVMASASSKMNGSDAMQTKRICSLIDDDDYAAAKIRAVKILKIINSHKVKPIPVPEINYDPKRDGDE